MKHGCEALDAPDFERYGEEFDARTGMGGVEIWLPVKVISVPKPQDHRRRYTQRVSS